MCEPKMCTLRMELVNSCCFGLLLMQLSFVLPVTCDAVNSSESTQESISTQVSKETETIHTKWSNQVIQPRQPVRIKRASRVKKTSRIGNVQLNTNYWNSDGMLHIAYTSALPMGFLTDSHPQKLMINYSIL